MSRTVLDVMREWLDSGDPRKVGAARRRLLLPPDPPPDPDPPRPPAARRSEPTHPIEAAAVGCAWRGPPRGGCQCHRCEAGQGDGGRADLLTCILCQRGRLRALPPPDGDRRR